MKLNRENLHQRSWWEAAEIALPAYDVDAVSARTVAEPAWAHFGIGNIFRVFLGGIADRLLNCGAMDRGLTCMECYDTEVVDRIYDPFDNLALSVILHNDGCMEKRVLGSMSEAVRAGSGFPEGWARAKEIFASPTLQMVSFTITEKGYAIRGASGEYFPWLAKELEAGPDHAASAMPVVTALLLHRYTHGAAPIALVSMDNCSQNGARFRAAVTETASAWAERGFVPEEFVRWISDENQVAFPWTMIDKITPRPGEEVAAKLAALGLEDMAPIMTSKNTFIAPFVNAEEPQYLVVEDHFPNGRPPLEQAGVYMTDRVTVNKSERMKVTACLNPIHSALAPFGQLLGITLFSDQIQQPDSLTLARRIGAEGMAVAPDPGILSPQAFLDECLNVRFPNPNLGDTVQRLLTDISQGLIVRFGETVKAYTARDGDARALRAVPLAIAGWVRYLLRVDDAGRAYDLSPDPMNEELTEALKTVRVGDPDSLKDQLKPILGNANLFGSDLYAAGLGDEIESLVRQMLAGLGAVEAVLHRFASES